MSDTGWTHRICERCWFSTPTRGLDIMGEYEVYRLPVMIKRDNPSLGCCCFCNQPCVTEIYVRADPKSFDEGHFHLPEDVDEE